MLPAKFPGLATASTIMKRIASKYPNKASHTFWVFPMHIKVMFILYCGLLSVKQRYV